MSKTIGIKYPKPMLDAEQRASIAYSLKEDFGVEFVQWEELEGVDLLDFMEDVEIDLGKTNIPLKSVIALLEEFVSDTTAPACDM